MCLFQTTISNLNSHALQCFSPTGEITIANRRIVICEQLFWIVLTLDSGGFRRVSFKISFSLLAFLSTMADDSANVRRSRRIAAKGEDRLQLYDNILDELEEEEAAQCSSKKSSTATQSKRGKIYRGQSKSKSESNGLFDRGLKAISIIGATSIDDEMKGSSDICYLVKFENGQFELVLNKAAHKYCPQLVIEFLESRILFKENETFDLPQELFTDKNQGNLQQM